MTGLWQRRVPAIAIGVVGVVALGLGPSIPVGAASTADLSLTLSGPGSVDQGAEAVYTATIHNGGPDTATGVVLTDTVPPGFTFDAAHSTSGCTVNGSTVTCANGPSIPSGFQLASQIAFRTTTTGSFTDSAGVTSAESDPTPADNSATASATTVGPPEVADMSVGFSMPSSAIEGQRFFGGLIVTNNGPDDSTGSSVSLTVPSGLTPQFSGCSASGSGYVCTLSTGSQPPGTGEAFALQFTPNATGKFVMSATVTGNLQDPNSANNTSSATVTVTARADLALTSSASPNPVVPGHQVTETIVLTNDGPSPAAAASLSASWTSDAKGGIDFESASVSTGSCSTSGETVACTVGDVAKGEQVVLTVVLQPRSKGTLTIDSSAASNTSDPNAANNSSTTIVQIS